VARVLEMVQLPGYERRYPRQLSGGQQQRVALARAVVFEPPVLLMDEPLGALDKKLREHMQSELKQIQRRLGVTVIYVTHDQEEALTLSDRVAVMRDGCIEQVGTPAELYEEPVNVFVADFLGESNFLTGTVRAADTDMVEVAGPAGAFRAARRGAPQPGSPVVASVRPERLTLLAPGEPAPAGANAWPGRIAETIYVGDATRYRVRVGPDEAGLTLTVKAQNRGGVGIGAVGDAVQVVWSPADTRLLADEASPDGLVAAGAAEPPVAASLAD